MASCRLGTDGFTSITHTFDTWLWFMYTTWPKLALIWNILYSLLKWSDLMDGTDGCKQDWTGLPGFFCSRVEESLCQICLSSC